MSPLLAPALVAAAASLAPKPGPVELVRQLGAPDYRDREAAGKALRVFQCAAEPAVRAAAAAAGLTVVGEANFPWQVRLHDRSAVAYRSHLLAAARA